MFALVYYAIFAAIDTSGWLLGALFGLLHGIVSATALVNVLLPVVHPRMGSTLSAADSSPLLEPPGFLMRNYGRGTPIATLLAHIAYGAIVGGFISIAGWASCLIGIRSRSPALEVVVAGGGVAALELVLALNDLAGDRVAVTLVAPEGDFTYRPPSFGEPFALGHTERYRLERLADDLGARLVPEGLAAVSADRHEITTTSGTLVSYDALVLAVGARPVPPFQHAITVGAQDTTDALTGLVSELGRRPRPLGGVRGPERRLVDAAAVRAGDHDGPARMDDRDRRCPVLVRHPRARAARDLRDRDEPGGARDARARGHHLHRLDIAPTCRTASCSSTLALSASRSTGSCAFRCSTGPATPGIPVDADGFIPVDAARPGAGYARRLRGSGDATAFPIKQGGLACQQADAVAEQISATAGAPIEPIPFRPVLRGKLMTGGRDRFLRQPSPTEGAPARSPSSRCGGRRRRSPGAISPHTSSTATRPTSTKQPRPHRTSPVEVPLDGRREPAKRLTKPSRKSRRRRPSDRCQVQLRTDYAQRACRVYSRARRERGRSCGRAPNGQADKRPARAEGKPGRLQPSRAPFAALT